MMFVSEIDQSQRNPELRHSTILDFDSMSRLV